MSDHSASRSPKRAKRVKRIALGMAAGTAIAIGGVSFANASEADGFVTDTIYRQPNLSSAEVEEEAAASCAEVDGTTSYGNHRTISAEQVVENGIAQTKITMRCFN